MIVLAGLSGAAMGYVLSRGQFCFHATWRGVFDEPRHWRLAQAYLVLLLLTTPVVQVLIAAGVLDPVVPSFTPAANVIGGLVFGVGMVVASSCVTGLFYKLGEGMLGAIVGIAAWAVGDVVVNRGPLESLRTSLTDSPVTVDEGAATLTNALPVLGAVVAVAAATAIALTVRRVRVELGPDDWAPVPLGAAAAAVITASWLLVTWEGSDYPFGTAGVPTMVWDELFGDRAGGGWWIPLALISLVPGAYLAARMRRGVWVRGETGRRYGQLGAGGLLMGAGAGLAGGCNLGHAMVGVPLLSLGSITTTVAMIAGVGAAAAVVRASRL